MFGFDIPAWALAVGRFLAAIPAWAWCLLLALVFALASGHYREQRNEARKALAVHLQADKDAIKVAKAAAKAAENKQREAMEAARAQWDKEKRDAIAKERAVAAGLRAGTLRLRQQWRGCESRAGAADGGLGRDAADELRAAAAAAVVRVGADADAQVTYLQGLIRSAPACFVVQP